MSGSRRDADTEAEKIVTYIKERAIFLFMMVINLKACLMGNMKRFAKNVW